MGGFSFVFGEPKGSFTKLKEAAFIHVSEVSQPDRNVPKFGGVVSQNDDLGRSITISLVRLPLEKAFRTDTDDSVWQFDGHATSSDGVNY